MSIRREQALDCPVIGALSGWLVRDSHRRRRPAVQRMPSLSRPDRLVSEAR
jgi:hypothetical protein